MPKRLCCLVLALCAANACFSRANSGPDFPLVPPHLEYIHRRLGAGPLSIHLVKIDRSQPDLAFTSSLARNTIYNLEPVSRQVQALDALLGKPLVAVNGDFFRIRLGPYRGDPLGLQVLRGELVSSPKNTCFWIDAEGRPHIAYVHPSFRATWPDGTTIPFDLNQQRGEGRAALYTPSMGSSTRTKDGIELILGNHEDSDWLPIRPGRTYKARIAALSGKANTPIPPDKVILSLPPALAGKIETTDPGTPVSLSFKTSPDLTGVRVAIGGGPVLIRDAKTQKFTGSQPRHPRTAIGWNAERFFLLVVDGRQEGLSIGMTRPSRIWPTTCRSLDAPTQ